MLTEEIVLNPFVPNASCIYPLKKGALGTNGLLQHFTQT